MYWLRGTEIVGLDEMSSSSGGIGATGGPFGHGSGQGLISSLVGWTGTESPGGWQFLGSPPSKGPKLHAGRGAEPVGAGRTLDWVPNFP